MKYPVIVKVYIKPRSLLWFNVHVAHFLDLHEKKKMSFELSSHDQMFWQVAGTDVPVHILFILYVKENQKSSFLTFIGKPNLFKDSVFSSF